MGGMGQFSGRMDGDVQLGIRTKLCPPCSSKLYVQVVIAWRTGKIIRTNVCCIVYIPQLYLLCTIVFFQASQAAFFS